MAEKEHTIAYHVKTFFKNAKIKDIMTSPARTIQVEESLSKASEMFTTYGISHLPVVDERNRLVGILSQKYLYKAISPRKFIEGELNPDPQMVIDGDSYYWKDALDRYILRNIMQANPFTLSADDAVAQAVIHMAGRRIGCIPIIDQKREVKGILTNQEIVDFTSIILRE